MSESVWRIPICSYKYRKLYLQMGLSPVWCAGLPSEDKVSQLCKCVDWGEKNMQVVHLLTADHCLQGRIVWTGEWEWGWDSFQILWEVRGDISCLPFSPLLLHNSVTTQFSECWQVPWAVAARQKLVHTRYYLPHHRQDLSSSQILHPPVWIMTQSALASPLPYNSLTLPAIILTCQAGDGESDSRLD